jgi:hypothetical protein
VTDRLELPAADAPVEGLERHILEQCMAEWPQHHPTPMQCICEYLDMNEEAGLLDEPEREALRREQRLLQARLEIHTERRLGHS